MAITDAAGNPIGPSNSAEATVPSTPGELGILPALLLTMGEEVARMSGTHGSRLTAPATVGDGSVKIESLLHWPDTGTFVVEGIEVAYARVVYTPEPKLDQLTWPDQAPAGMVFPVGQFVEDSTGQFSARERARSAMLVGKSDGDWLLALGRSHGEARPWPMSDATLRKLFTTLFYLDRGSWWAVFRVLDAALAEHTTKLTDGVTAAANPTRITSATASFLAAHVHRWVRVAGKVHRIVNVDTGGGTWIELAPGAGPAWVGASFGDATGVTVELLPFRIAEDPEIYPSRVVIDIFVPSSFVNAPPTFLQPSGAAATPVGVPKGGQIMSGPAVAGSTGQPFYISGGAAKAVATFIDDVLVLGVEPIFNLGSDW